MRRCRLFEFHEPPETPEALRRLVTDFLEMMEALYQPFGAERTIALLLRAMRATGATQFVDLCSGSGGPWFALVQQLRERTGRPVSVVLSDLLPSRDVVRRAAATPGLTCLDRPVDARRVPEGLHGVRTLFNALHHFQPDEARAILQDAVDRGAPIAVFEVVRPTWMMMVRTLLLTASIPFFTPLVKPVRWWRLVLVYVLPVAPALLLWDSVVSVLRACALEELRAMAAALHGPRYAWEVGTYTRRAVEVIYLVGYPA